MGTAGPIRLAKEHILKDNPSGLFFVFNSDVICDYPLSKFIEFHKAHGKEGTILATTVEGKARVHFMHVCRSLKVRCDCAQGKRVD